MMALFEDDNSTRGEKMIPTVEWMREKYDKFNAELFNGQLGACNFIVKDLATKRFGSFGIEPLYGQLRYNTSTRQMFIRTVMYGNGDIYIDKDNFVKLCNPTIYLNSGFINTEDNWCNTLIHEMCHYYTYMRGYAPKQAHGREFKEIASIVSYRARQYSMDIEITTRASADKIANREFSDKNQERYDRRMTNKKLRANYILVKNPRKYTIELLNTHSDNVINTVIQYASHSNDGTIVCRLTNPELIERLYESGYRHEMRTYRYWGIPEDKPIMKDIFSDNNNYEILYEHEG